MAISNWHSTESNSLNCGFSQTAAFDQPLWNYCLPLNIVYHERIPITLKYWASLFLRVSILYSCVYINGTQNIKKYLGAFIPYSALALLSETKKRETTTKKWSLSWLTDNSNLQFLCDAWDACSLSAKLSLMGALLQLIGSRGCTPFLQTGLVSHPKFSHSKDELTNREVELVIVIIHSFSSNKSNATLFYKRIVLLTQDFHFNNLICLERKDITIYFSTQIQEKIVLWLNHSITKWLTSINK